MKQLIFIQFQFLNFPNYFTQIILTTNCIYVLHEHFYNKLEIKFILKFIDSLPYNL